MNKSKEEKSLEIIIEQLITAKRVLVFPHILMDGDCLGSSIAICSMLRQMGKEAYVLIEDDIPLNLRFLSGEFCIQRNDIISDVDLSVAVDCSDVERLGTRGENFFSAEQTVSIDHHVTNKSFAKYNYLDAKAGATGEIIFEIFQLLHGKVKMDMIIAEALYTAIATDTGNFQYTNTTAKTHIIISELLEFGIDLEKISVELYQNSRYEKIVMNACVLNTLELFCNGKANLAYATKEMYEKTGASLDETEGVIENLRSIRGIEISAFLKEKKPNEIKVSFRSKTYGDVSKISQKFGGGGHKKAAGCTIRKSLKEAIALVKEEICAEMES